jgi:EAL domain-containing protein (putative c-di-GMP-specific phosphodiesterase class I)/GGDEF domain-containing protein
MLSAREFCRFAARMKKERSASVEGDTHYAIIVVEFDRFREWSLAFGYTFQDELMAEIGGRLAERLHGGEYAFIGEGEVALLTVLARPEELGETVEQVRRWLIQPYFAAGGECYLNIHIGASILEPGSDEIESVMQEAAIAVLNARRQGKNVAILFDEKTIPVSPERFRLEAELNKAIRLEQLTVYYQPRLELATGKISGLEALVRWQHPERGIIPPVEFIPVAEECGLIMDIGNWVLRQACLQKKGWMEAGITDALISVNISPVQFQDPGFADQVIGIIQATGVEPQGIELEITESAVMRNVGQTTAALEKLCRFGVTFSIDDFGTGYSSLNYIKHFPIKCLKIDRSFVKNIITDRSDFAITQAIINLGHTLNLQIVAEGVEDQNQLDLLRETKCTTIQGYLLSPPVAAYEVERILGEDKFGY